MSLSLYLHIVSLRQVVKFQSSSRFFTWPDPEYDDILGLFEGTFRFTDLNSCRSLDKTSVLTILLVNGDGSIQRFQNLYWT